MRKLENKLDECKDIASMPKYPFDSKVIKFLLIIIDILIDISEDTKRSNNNKTKFMYESAIMKYADANDMQDFDLAERCYLRTLELNTKNEVIIDDNE